MAILGELNLFLHPNGLDTRGGRSWPNAIKTLSKANTLAVAAATAYPGIQVNFHLAPGSYVGATIAANYVRLLGAIEGGGYAKPDITSLVTVTGQGFVAQRARFADGLLLRGNGFLIGGDSIDDQCVLENADGDALTLEGDAANDDKSASEGRIVKNLIRDALYGVRFKNAGAPSGVGVTDVVLRENQFYGITNEDLIDEDASGSNDNTFFRCHAWNYHMDKNKARYVKLDQGGASRGTVGGEFAVDGAGTLDNTVIVLSQHIVAGRIYKASGLVDAGGF